MHAIADLTTMQAVLDRGVVSVRFSRPERLNSITEEFLSDIDRVVSFAESEEDVKALALTGEGRAFSVGLDLGLLERAFVDAAYFESVLTRFAGVCARLESAPVPVVAAVNGLARAGGFELLLACDVVLMSAAARIGDVHTAFGVVPGAGASWRLPRAVGYLRAKEILLSGRWVLPEEALAIGLVTRVVPPESLGDATEEVLASFRDKSRNCLGAVKAQVASGYAESRLASIERERRIFLDYVTAPGSDALEGFTAWQESREPRWASVGGPVSGAL